MSGLAQTDINSYLKLCDDEKKYLQQRFNSNNVDLVQHFGINIYPVSDLVIVKDIAVKLKAKRLWAPSLANQSWKYCPTDNQDVNYEFA